VFIYLFLLIVDFPVIMLFYDVISAFECSVVDKHYC